MGQVRLVFGSDCLTDLDLEFGRETANGTQGYIPSEVVERDI